MNVFTAYKPMACDRTTGLATVLGPLIENLSSSMVVSCHWCGDTTWVTFRKPPDSGAAPCLFCQRGVRKIESMLARRFFPLLDYAAQDVLPVDPEAVP